jgi:glucose/mannose transport system permease protein
MSTAVNVKPVKEKVPVHLRVLRVIYYLIMICTVLLYLLPFWGTVTTSFKTAEEALTTNPLSFPEEISFDAYVDSFEELKESLITSVIITIGGALGSVALGSVCAYGLSKYRFKFDGLFFLLLSAAIYLPYQAILVPLLKTISNLGLYDTRRGLILIHIVYGMPMCTSMFRGFYSDIPDALIKQAMIDGNGPWQIYRKIVLPNTTIATVTVLVFQFTSVWNEMLFALTMGGFDCMPATIALNQMVGALSAEFNMQMAGSIWLTLPVLLLYMFLGKYLIRGYMAGAVTAS